MESAGGGGGGGGGKACEDEVAVDGFAVAVDLEMPSMTEGALPSLLPQTLCMKR